MSVSNCFKLLFALFLAGAGARLVQAAGLPLLEEAPPFSDVNARDVAEGQADLLWLQTMADDAVDAGFFNLAENLYRRALELPGVDAGRTRALQLGLTTALIAQLKTDAAAEILMANAVGGDPAWSIRIAAVAFQRDDFAALGQALAGIETESVAPADRGWFHLLHAKGFERAGNLDRAGREFERALAASISKAQTAVFRLEQIQSQLREGEASEGLAAQLKRLMEEKQGDRIGYQYALQYAVVLDALDRSEEAMEVLTAQRKALPPDENQLRDQTLLMLGLIGLAGVDPAQGREAFRDLLRQGSDRVLQQAALVRLASSAPAQGGSGTAALRQLYDELLDRAHPLYEDLLFFSAELALRNGNLVRAETDIESLFTRYPGTELRRNALALLASASWQGQRYRNAASYVSQLRALSEVEARKGTLAVLQGECYYRAGLQTGTAEDFRNAAEAYGAAERQLDLAEDAPGDSLISRGSLFFQRVMATIRSGDLEEAARLLDVAALSPELDAAIAESRWQAEWNFVRALQANGEAARALARVESLAEAPDAPPELHLRFLWLSAQLSLDAGKAGDTAERVDRVLAFLESAEGMRVTEDDRVKVASNAALLAAQARLETGDVEGGMHAVRIGVIPLVRLRNTLFDDEDRAPHALQLRAVALPLGDN
ncbi:MAG: tetratricopeptide repeat protein, partial [Opitutaceae bacterium]